MIACVELSYNEDNGSITYTETDCIPTWVDKYTDSGKTIYKIIPLLDDLDSNETLKASGHTARAKSALSDITQFLGAEYIKSE